MSVITIHADRQKEFLFRAFPVRPAGQGGKEGSTGGSGHCFRWNAPFVQGRGRCPLFNLTIVYKVHLYIVTQLSYVHQGYAQRNRPDGAPPQYFTGFPPADLGWSGKRSEAQPHHGFRLAEGASESVGWVEPAAQISQWKFGWCSNFWYLYQYSLPSFSILPSIQQYQGNWQCPPSN